MTDYKDYPIRANINRSVVGKVPKGANFWDYTELYIAEDTTPYKMACEVWRGFGVAAVWKGQRLKENFISVQYLLLDFDTKDIHSAVDTLLAHPFIEKYASFINPTASSTLEEPKTRVTFILESVITDVDKFETLYKSVLELFPHADKSTKDINRIFYGSYHCDLVGLWGILPDSVIDEMILRYNNKPTPKRKAVTFRGSASGDHSRYERGAVTGIINDIASSVSGEHHHALYKGACAMGSLVTSDWASISEGEAIALLEGVVVGWSRPDERKRVLRCGLRDGGKSPRPVPPAEIKHTAVLDEV